MEKEGNISIFRCLKCKKPCLELDGVDGEFVCPPCKLNYSLVWEEDEEDISIEIKVKPIKIIDKNKLLEGKHEQGF